MAIIFFTLEALASSLAKYQLSPTTMILLCWLSPLDTNTLAVFSLSPAFFHHLPKQYFVRANRQTSDNAGVDLYAYQPISTENNFYIYNEYLYPKIKDFALKYSVLR